MKKEKNKKIEKEIEECDGGCGDCGGGDCGGTGTADVLGNCDHESGDGWLEPGCFHLPKNVLSVPARREIPSKKKKGAKNPYAIGCKTTGKLNERRFMASLCGVDLNESLETLEENLDFAKLAKLRASLKNPGDIDDFLAAHEDEIYELLGSGKLDAKEKSVLRKACELAKTAVRNGWNFVKKHWKKLILVVLVIAAFVCLGKYAAAALNGMSIFGKGSTPVHATKTADAESVGSEQNSPMDADELTPTGRSDLDFVLPPEYEEVDEKDIERNECNGTVGIKCAGDNFFRYWLKDGRIAVMFDALPDRYFAVKKKNAVDESRYSPRDLMRWEASGRDPRFFPRPSRREVNIHAIVAEIKQKFPNQFNDVKLEDLGGTWRVTFSVEGFDGKLTGQRLVKTAIPRIDDIVRLLRLRGIETNQYNIHVG